MAAILVKVFALALRTAAKPLGFQFQSWAMEHPVFRNSAVGFAQVIAIHDVWPVVNRRLNYEKETCYEICVADSIMKYKNRHLCWIIGACLQSRV